mmetsp:Transcript_27042/g.69477  ORF Transcript_27042/g.69477 Transcript_27042/m.69477 type:complete len:367 (+) Transcript_27042:198-1298(+)|eukprot:jgi/Tetstr1/449867/TSEL_036926.t1
MDFSFVGPSSAKRKRPPGEELGRGESAGGEVAPAAAAQPAQPVADRAAGLRFLGALDSRPAAPRPPSQPSQPPQPPSQPPQPVQHAQAVPRLGDGAAPSAAAPAGAPLAPLQPPPNTILVSPRQVGNPLLRHLRAVRHATHPGLGASGPDYLLGEGAAALFVSLRYHLLHPEYVHARLRGLLAGGAFRHRFLLAQVDTDDCVRPLEAITKAAVRADVTLLLAWSPEEAARWLETLKAYERKPADAIQERLDGDYGSRLAAALTTLKGVNRTDVATLGRAFGSLAALMAAPMEGLSACPGLGPTKVARLHDALHQPFRRTLQQRRRPGPSDAAAPDEQRAAPDPAPGSGSNSQASQGALEPAAPGPT